MSRGNGIEFCDFISVISAKLARERERESGEKCAAENNTIAHHKIEMLTLIVYLRTHCHGTKPKYP